MTLYRYATLMRPAGPGSVPREGLHACEDVRWLVCPSGHTAYSIADYERPLTDKEVRDYELESLGCVEVD
jgi:hypothetical protein